MKVKTSRFIIPSADVDFNKDYRPVSFLRDAQEIANVQATGIGMGYRHLIQCRCAWVLSRLHVEVLRAPKWGEEVDFSTWHKGAEGVFYIRDFKMDSTGVSGGAPQEPLFRATSSWLILDLESRRMVRPDRLFERLAEKGLEVPAFVPGEGDPTAWMEDAVAERCARLKSPADLQPCGSREVRYSDIDFNGHANNAKYVEWAFDLIEPETLRRNRLKNYHLSINHETRLGDRVSFYRSGAEGPALFIEGRLEEDGTSVFQMKILFDTDVKL